MMCFIARGVLVELREAPIVGRFSSTAVLQHFFNDASLFNSGQSEIKPAVIER